MNGVVSDFEREFFLLKPCRLWSSCFYRFPVIAWTFSWIHFKRTAPEYFPKVPMELNP